MTRLVILAPNWLGDAVMALPAIADVRRSAPDLTIVVAARPAIAPLFALAPGAAYGGAKRWPPRYFGELAEALAADGVQCVIIGAAADRETAAEVGRSPEALRSPWSILNLVGTTDLATLAGVFSLCRALV